LVVTRPVVASVASSLTVCTPATAEVKDAVTAVNAELLADVAIAPDEKSVAVPLTVVIVGDPVVAATEAIEPTPDETILRASVAECVGNVKRAAAAPPTDAVPSVVERVRPCEIFPPETVIPVVAVKVVVAAAGVIRAPVGVIAYAPPIVVGHETVPITADVSAAAPERTMVNVPVEAVVTVLEVKPLMVADVAVKVHVVVMFFEAGPAVTVYVIVPVSAATPAWSVVSCKSAVIAVPAGIGAVVAPVFVVFVTDDS
jgi:hypothetical protein